MVPAFGDNKIILSEDNSKSSSKKQLTLSSKGIKSSGVDVADNRTNRGMVLPFQPLSLAFNNVNYYVDMPAVSTFTLGRTVICSLYISYSNSICLRQKKNLNSLNFVYLHQEMKSQGVDERRLQLLRDVSGAFRPGVLTALVGVSGAGKTTLMDVLAGRKTGGYIEGSIKISGYPKNQSTFTRVSGYCEQNDIHSPYVTVYESLLYSAWLRLASDVKTETRKA